MTMRRFRDREERKKKKKKGALEKPVLECHAMRMPQRQYAERDKAAQLQRLS